MKKKMGRKQALLGYYLHLKDENCAFSFTSVAKEAIKSDLNQLWIDFLIFHFASWPVEI